MTLFKRLRFVGAGVLVYVLYKFYNFGHLPVSILRKHCLPGPKTGLCGRPGLNSLQVAGQVQHHCGSVFGVIPLDIVFSN